MPDTQWLAPAVRAYVARVEDVNPKRRTVVGKINTAAVDHYHTVIDPRGIERGNRQDGYLANPVVLHEHGMDPARGSLPVARNNWIRPAIGPNGPELIAESDFGRRDDFADMLFEMYRDGFMRGFSVRVVPNIGGKNGPPTADEIRARPELADCLWMYRSTRLAEYSTTSVPGNPECLATGAAEARGLLALAARGLWLPPDLVARAQAVVDAEGDGEGRGDDPPAAPPPPAVVLPPLGGRSLADLRKARVEELRKLLDPRAIADELTMHADFARGKV